MKSGKTLWDEMCISYQEGVNKAEAYGVYRATLNGRIDNEQYEHVRQLLEIQAREAHWWKDACLSYFRTFSRMPFKPGVDKPEHDLDYYRGLRFYYVPGI